MSGVNEKRFEKEQAKLMADLTFQMERFCRMKESFFASKFDLTPVEFRCLRIIHENLEVPSKTLVKIMHLSPGRITHLIDSLEEKGLIVRQLDLNDRRSILVRLNDDALVFFGKIQEEYIQLHHEILKYIPKGKRVEIFNNLEYLFLALKDWSNKLEV